MDVLAAPDNLGLHFIGRIDNFYQSKPHLEGLSMVSQEIKVIFGYLLLIATVVGFFIAFAATSYLLAVLFIVGGLLTWMVYLNLANVKINRPTGAVLIIFGVLLASAIFMAFGIEQDMWGGYHIKPDGALLSLVILFFAVMPGLVFFYFHRPAPLRQLPAQPPTPAPEPPTPSGIAPPEPPPSEVYEYPEWTEEEYAYYSPEAWAAYYEGEEYEEEEEEEGEEEE